MLREIKFRFRVDGIGGLRTVIELLKYINSKQLISDVKSDLRSSKSIAKFQSVVDEVVETEIYSKSTTGGGTGNLRRSFKAIPSPTEGQDVTVFSDPSEGVKIKAGQYEGAGSYGVFFLRPVEFDSFIQAPSPLSSIRYRPFYKPLERELVAESREVTLHSIRERIRRKAPRVRQ